PQPAYSDVREIPTLKQGRFAPLRYDEILQAASRDHDDPPPKPGPSDCCGSSCQPCVKELWSEELRAWKERWGKGS
ncbi:hypothetical protein IE81DRAFT_280352, partial [Ceraceosorus guamensis]